MFLKQVQDKFLNKPDQAELNFSIEISECKRNSREISLIILYFVYYLRCVYISSSLFLRWIELFRDYLAYIKDTYILANE